MVDIVRVMRSKHNFYALQGATDMEIESAEQMLGTCFAKEYRDYVSILGVASFAGHELTGVCKPKRLNVIEVTMEQRMQNQKIPRDWYVVEETHIDSIVIWQAPSGEIYQSAHGMPPTLIAKSMSIFLEGV